jgi:hypothetical protein
MAITKDSILLGTVAAVCAALLIVALMMRPERAPEAVPEGEAGEALPSETPDEAAAFVTGEGAAGGVADGAEGAAEATASPAPTGPPSFTSEPNRREVLLFFQEAEGDSLGPERRKIFLTSSVADQAKQIVVELINGPQDADLLPTLPPETRLLGLYLDRAGTAFVDLSQEVVDYHPGGTEEEIATIFSLVDSLTYNLPEIQRVRILVAGEERDSLKDHLDLRRDYRQNLSIVDMDRRPGQ